jgi:hypothetical protein
MAKIKIITGFIATFLFLMMWIIAPFAEKYLEEKTAYIAGIIYAAIFFASVLIFGIIHIKEN